VALQRRGRFLAVAFVVIVALNLIVCPPMKSRWLGEIIWALGTGLGAVVVLIGTGHRWQTVRSLSYLGCLVVLALPFVRAREKPGRAYRNLFTPSVEACRHAVGDGPDSDGAFRGKVVIVVEPAEGGSESFPFRKEDFSATTPDELGSVLFASIKRKKVGTYVDSVTKMHSHDAMQVTYRVTAVDTETEQAMARTTIVGEPPEHNPPEADEESAQGKADRRLSEWIHRHMRPPG